MKKNIKINHFKVTALLTIVGFLSACGGGGGSDPDSSNNPIEAHADFLSKAEAVDFNQIHLYAGHIKPTDRTFGELDTSNLNSGDLITIDIEVQLTGNIQDYALAVQLVPKAIFSQLDSGSTLGEVINDKVDALQGEGLIDLGGAYIDEISPGVLHAIVHAKLPVLKNDAVYKVSVTPSLQFLSPTNNANEADIKAIPLLIDDRELVIAKLDNVSVKVINPLDLTVDNDFTQLELNGEFDANGFSIEPVFQTHINVDLTSFNPSEEIIISLSYASPASGPLALGLLSSDANGAPVISTEARFLIANTDETSVRLPVVAFAPRATQNILLKQSTNIRDVADTTVNTGNFDLEVFHDDNGTVVSAGDAVRLSIPLVSQSNKLKLASPEQAIGFTVLRAGSTNAACLLVPSRSLDIDSGLFTVDSTNEISATTCAQSPPSSMLWRYDVGSKQLINKVKDSEGNNYCITAINDQVVSLPGSSGSNIIKIKAEKCSIPGPFPGPAALSTQKFDFEGNKIKSSRGYLNVESIGTPEVFVTNTANVLVAVDFFRNLNGLTLDQDGRLFYVGKFYDRNWGDEDLAQVSISYGGESYIDYMPVLGTTTEGHATLSASLFGASTDLVGSSFAIKRYFSKKISFSGNNSPDVVVGNGAQFSIDVLGNNAISGGSLEESTITETFNPAESVGNVLLAIPGIVDQTSTPLEFGVNETFLETTIMVSIIPVHITGGIDGSAKLTLALTTPGVGVDIDVKEDFKLGGFLNADVLVAGIEGTIEVINQDLTFSANAGFNTQPATPTKLSFDIGSELNAGLKLLKGEVKAFVQYPKICLCRSVGSIVKRDKVIYTSPYLFNNNWKVYGNNITSTVIEY